MRKLQRDTQTQGQAALLVALFAALLAALLLVRLELGLHLVLRPAAHVSGECKSQVSAKGLESPRTCAAAALMMAPKGNLFGIFIWHSRRLLESGPFPKGHDLLEVENQ